MVVLKLQQEVERYQNLPPLLKFIGGEVLSVDHWQEMFRILQTEKGMTPEKFKFGDLLKSTDLILQHAEDLKVP